MHELADIVFEFVKRDFLPGLAGYMLHSFNHGLAHRFWHTVKHVTRHKQKGGGTNG